MQQDHAQDVADAGSNGHADADLTRTLRNGVGHDAVEADSGENEGKDGEGTEEQSLHARVFGLISDHVLHGAGMQQGEAGIETLNGAAEFGDYQLRRDRSTQDEFGAAAKGLRYREGEIGLGRRFGA